MKEISEIFCKSFCDNLKITEIGSDSYAVATPFEISSGDPVSFYILDVGSGKYRIEDDGMTVPSMIASGINIADGTRKKEFERIISRCGISYQENTGELVSESVAYESLPDVAFRFVDMLLKLDGLKVPFKHESIAGMFKDDVLNKIHESFDSKAKIYTGDDISKEIAEFAPDFVIQYGENDPVAVYLAVSDQKIWEAVALKALSKNQNEIKYSCNVMAMFDRVGTKMVTKRGLVTATNRLDASAYFYDDQMGSMHKVQEEIGFKQIVAH